MQVLNAQFDATTFSATTNAGFVGALTAAQNMPSMGMHSRGYMRSHKRPEPGCPVSQSVPKVTRVPRVSGSVGLERAGKSRLAPRWVATPSITGGHVLRDWQSDAWRIEQQLPAYAWAALVLSRS